VPHIAQFHSQADGRQIAFRFAHVRESLSRPSIVHVPRFATDESLIGFHCASHFVNAASVHRIADAMQHEPCGSLNDFQTRAFVGTNAVLAVRSKPHRTKPVVQTKRGILEMVPLDRKLFLAVQAFPHQPRVEKREPFRRTMWTYWTLGTPLGSG
jgi:hypothetical protein